MIRSYLKYRKRQKWAKQISAMSAQSILKGFILDTHLMEGQQLTTLLGLPEITEEEINESHERTQKVDDSLPLILFFSAHLAQSVMSYQDAVTPWTEGMSEEEKQAIEVWLAKVMTANTIGILSQFNDLKLIEVKE